MDELDKKIESTFKSKSNDYKLSTRFINKVNETLTSLPEKRKNYTRNFKVLLATSCCSLMLVSGIVFAKDIEKIFVEKFRSLGKGISTATENGYIAKSEANLVEKDMQLINNQTGELIDTIHTKSKIESAVVSNGNIGIELYFEFDSKLNNYINLGKNVIDGNIDFENSHTFDFNDIFILDNENNIIYLTEDSIDKCKNYFATQNANLNNYEISSNGPNNIIGTIDNSDSNLIKVTVEISLKYNESLYPKKLYVSFNNFNLLPKLGNDEEIEVKMKSNDNWFMEIDIPEKMYNITEEHYKVTKCENENFDVYTAKVTNTGFEIGIVVTNEEKPIYPSKIDEIDGNKDPYSGDYTKESYIEYYGEEYVHLKESYYTQLYLIRTNGMVPSIPWIEQTEGCYVLNSNGEKFLNDSKNHSRTEPPIKDKYCYNVCFSMTKFDATDEITVVIDYKGQPVNIELEKINK